MNPKTVLYSILALLISASCSQLETPDNSKEEFSVYLIDEDAETKVINDGIHTRWEKGDLVSLFFAETGTAGYSKNHRFSIENETSGRFSGTLLDPTTDGTSYDWYAIYPYNSQLSSPVSKSFSLYSSTVRQSGNNNMAHLAGTTFPLVGSCKNIAFPEYPTIRMKNVLSVIDFNVTNASEEGIVVNSINVIAPKMIAGDYTVDFSGESISVNIAANNVCLNNIQVDEGVTISKGESAMFYLPVIPFAAESGEEFLIYVNATAGEVQKTYRVSKTMTEQVSFSSGKIKTFNLNYLPSSAPLAVTEADFKTLNNGKNTSSFKDLYTTWDGWTLQGGAAFNNVQIPEITELGAALNGRLNQIGVLTSPVLADGCGKLKFRYGKYRATDQISFRVDVKDADGAVKYTKTITAEVDTALKTEVWDFEEDVNVAGPFVIEITNLCPQQSPTSSKDRVTVFDMSWTNFPA